MRVLLVCWGSLFDECIASTGTSGSSGESSDGGPAGAVIGGIIGAVVLAIVIIIVLVVVIVWMRRSKRKQVDIVNHNESKRECTKV